MTLLLKVRLKRRDFNFRKPNNRTLGEVIIATKKPPFRLEAKNCSLMSNF